MGNSCCSSESTSSSEDTYEDTPYHVRKMFTFSDREIRQYNKKYNTKVKGLKDIVN